ncbi:MAG: glutamine-hydrolyzing GMP synthase [Wolbachia endosymbiont of Xenopsylla cheopis]
MSKIAIIDFGSQFTQLIARRIREMRIYSEIFPCTVAVDEISDFDAFILSGGPDSVNTTEPAVLLLHEIMNLNQNGGIPILGICYGKQLICHYFGVQIQSDCKKEFGRTKIKILADSPIIDGLWNVGSKIDVWMSHSDSVINAPSGFNVIAVGAVSNAAAIIGNEARKIYCTQFHPEVRHTNNGTGLLSNFLDIAKCKRNWTMDSFSVEQIKKIKNEIGNKQVIGAVSGGVDSSVAAVLMHKAIGEQMHCIFIDTGLLRKNQAHDTKAIFEKIGVPLISVDKSDLFFEKLKGIVDPEEKRKIIGNTFIDIFTEEARKIGNIDFLMQGTIYSDVIESGFGSNYGKDTKIKSHHNVGGLPEKMQLELVEPLRSLFKDEVRLLGKELELPDDVLFCHPFPGPGLALRVIGEVTEEKVKTLQEIDCIYINMMKDYNLYSIIWQAFAILLPIKAVGVMGDRRTYEYVCALRAVTSSDAMTADAFPFEAKQQYEGIFWDFLQNVSNAIVNQVKNVNRIVYDITSKPPATIEWE